MMSAWEFPCWGNALRMLLSITATGRWVALEPSGRGRPVSGLISLPKTGALGAGLSLGGNVTSALSLGDGDGSGVTVPSFGPQPASINTNARTNAHARYFFLIGDHPFAMLSPMIHAPGGCVKKRDGVKP